ncbi:FAD-dependent thymidylate synthase [Streptomyces katsurahamanus]|uniref:FAD-dependent thymidylate synthase n=1 Tax=Streptomyces katsurahamanus TaxID=2577098 RepID=A0ABW9P3P9_9ACTN|nr:FAD-dependent thymidylate synthase [Streptomyces katsurahamanus]MQS40016.1 FAD-dependent thymidylate synthase [Streptomyces katsurahamanus]
MHVDVIAATTIGDLPLFEAYGYDAYHGERTSDGDALAEAAGRICYKSFNRPNPKTARNADYLANIIRQGHYSVMEHASVSFLVRGVSRALLAELSRHRHLSFSVVSQRYVNYADTQPVIPPALTQDHVGDWEIHNAYRMSLDAYETLVTHLVGKGLKRKEAREAARCVLPNAAPVDMVVTGNLRAWRDVLGKRWHVAADAEIREFAGKVLGELRRYSPNCVQDIPEEPYK